MSLRPWLPPPTIAAGRASEPGGPARGGRGRNGGLSPLEPSFKKKKKAPARAHRGNFKLNLKKKKKKKRGQCTNTPLLA